MSENEEYEIEFYRNQMQTKLEEQNERFKPAIKNAPNQDYKSISMLDFLNELYSDILVSEESNTSLEFKFGQKIYRFLLTKGEIIGFLNHITDKKQNNPPKIIDPETFQKDGESVMGMLSWMLPMMIQNSKAMQKVGYNLMPLSYSINNDNFITFMHPESAIEFLKNVKQREMFDFPQNQEAIPLEMSNYPNPNADDESQDKFDNNSQEHDEKTAEEKEQHED